MDSQLSKINTYFNWKEFLKRRLTGARTLPSNFYSKVLDSLKSRFRCDLTVEVVDKWSISQVKVWTIDRITGKKLQLRYYDTKPSSAERRTLKLMAKPKRCRLLRALDQEHNAVLCSSNSDSEPDDMTNSSSFRCILNEESPDLDNPDFYNCKTCSKGFIHIRSRKLFQEEKNYTSDVTAENHDKPSSKTNCADSVSNIQNYERSHLEIPQSSVQSIKLPVQHLPAYNTGSELNDQQRSFPEKTKCVPACETTAGVICAVCEKVLSSKYALITHLRVHQRKITGRRPFLCDKCGRQFIEKRSLDDHKMLAHGAEARFHCNHCSEGFMTKYKHQNHLKLHGTNFLSEFPFKCDKCPKRFNQEKGLKRHRTHYHKTNFGIWKCDKCPELFFSNRRGFRKHINLVHRTEDPYKCDECEFRYSCRTNWTRHNVNNHGASTNFKCTTCQRYFMCYRDLIRHSRVHK